MSDLERFGRAIGSARMFEPRTAIVHCKRHGTKNVTIFADEVVVMCCVLGYVINIPCRMGAIGWRFVQIPTDV